MEWFMWGVPVFLLYGIYMKLDKILDSLSKG